MSADEVNEQDAVSRRRGPDSRRLVTGPTPGSVVDQRPAPGATSGDQLYQALRKAVLLAAAVWLVIAFLNAILVVVLVSLFAVILALALNVPVTWLERHRVPRAAGTVIVEAGIAIVVAGLVWVVAPRLAGELQTLGENVPSYAEALEDRARSSVGGFPAVRDALDIDGQRLRDMLPSAGAVLTRVGTLTVGAAGVVVLTIALLGLVSYAVVRPRPLIRGYLHLFPSSLQASAARAFARSWQMVTAWLWANIVVGAVEGVAATAFLSLVGVPGAAVWGVLAFFAELVPKLGGYIMSIPPILVGLAVSPAVGLVVLAFYLILLQLTANVLDPIVRGRAMRLHPTVLLFAVLAMGAAFGFFGALIATPVAGVAAAFVEEF